MQNIIVLLAREGYEETTLMYINGTSKGEQYWVERAVFMGFEVLDMMSEEAELDA